MSQGESDSRQIKTNHLSRLNKIWLIKGMENYCLTSLRKEIVLIYCSRIHDTMTDPEMLCFHVPVKMVICSLKEK